ncbi:hypothetical protein FHS89_000006 [Rubricella aquisinus]|uniref:Uncharacterized protein n=1 Tax=Rubricella aquisinus TaxID=2028108 RepID=A0A840WFS3_9RHOB|nr:hypothetical protein [Rubricella aquisinus]
MGEAKADFRLNPLKNRDFMLCPFRCETECRTADVASSCDQDAVVCRPCHCRAMKCAVAGQSGRISGKENGPGAVTPGPIRFTLWAMDYS